jgi:hypothetical protein
MRRFFWLLTATLGVVALMTAAPGNSKPPTGCLVTNARTNVQYTDLQPSVDDAAAGDTLLIRNTCSTDQNGVIISKDLTLQGQQPKGSPPPTIAGSEIGDLGEVLTAQANLVLTTLTVSGGLPTSGDDGLGGGILALGSLTLNSAIVTGNARNGIGGGIRAAGDVTLNGNSRVSGNSARGDNDTPAYGGGVWIGPDKTLTLNGKSTISGNSAFDGAGVYTFESKVILAGTSKITGNQASDHGGGIYNSNGVLIGVTGKNVLNNTPDDIYP